MRVLVVGGSGFLGGAITSAAVAAGHQVAALTRGKAPVPPGATALVGDGRHTLAPLPAFDLVLDTRAYLPGDVHRLFDAMAVPPASYVLVSSISAYDGFPGPGTDETAPATAADPETVALVEADPGKIGEYYGPLKRATEQAATKRMAGRACLIRPGLIVGPGDPTDRFTFWVRRVARGGRLPLPLPPDRPVQVIDAHDLALFCLQAGITGLAGPINATGHPLRFDEMIATIANVAEVPLQPHWLPLRRFLDLGLAPWSDLPLILPDDPDHLGMLQVSTARAVSAGLACRPLSETVRATLDWDRGRCNLPLHAGFGAESEAALLA